MAKNKPDQFLKAVSNVHAGDVARYVFLPGILPRLEDLFQRGAGSIAVLMALVFAAVRLLPPNHPYLIPSNRGRFGIRHVFGEAWSRLSFKRENIDQVIIFFALIAGFVLLVLQFVYVFFTLIIHPAMAGTFTGMFATPEPDKDVALMLLDSVFGVPGMYNSCVSVGDCGAAAPTFTTFPTPFQQGLQALFEYYSLAMLVIAVLIVLYYLFIVVGETAQTGTPFGRRFDHIWAPLRLVMAIGLLVPLNYGYNGGQYIVLITARLASGFATNAWLDFNTSVAGSPLGYSETTPTEPTTQGYPTIGGTGSNYALIARPPLPDVTPLVNFMTIVQSCKVAYETLYSSSNLATDNETSPINIKAWMVKKGAGAVELTSGYDYNDALTYYNNGPIVIVFGDRNAAKWTNMDGFVNPLCGQVIVPVKAVDPSMTGVTDMQKGYFDWILTMYYDDQFQEFGIIEGCLWLEPTPDSYSPGGGGGGGSGQCDIAQSVLGETGDQYEDPPDTWKQTESTTQNDAMQAIENTAYQDMVTGITATVDTQTLARGWGGAGNWFNQISQWNGAFIGAVKDIPSVSKMPEAMEKVASSRAGADQNVTANTMYDLNQTNGKPIDWVPNQDEQQIALELDNVYKYWLVPKSTTPTQGQSQSNAIIDMIHLLFGAEGLYDITENDYVNPLAMLVALGNSILNGAVRNLLIANTLSAGGGFLSVFDSQQVKGFGQMLQGGAGFFMSLVTVAIGIGVTLYYVLPFMPFLYFYFAVGQWVKSIFEAMVGVPLWALAHLKINGEGLPTESAIDGYFMIFEIFLRPILTVFGLLASVTIFSALVRTLNNIWPLVTTNLTGFDCVHCDNGDTVMSAAIGDFKRDTLDQFFFTLLYTIVVYMIGTSSFKMIDQVPDNVLRWMNKSVQSFAQIGREDVGRHLGEHAAAAVTIVQNQLGPASLGISQGAGALVGQGAKALMGENKALALGESSSKTVSSITGGNMKEAQAGMDTLANLSTKGNPGGITS